MTANKFDREYAKDQAAVMDEAAKALEERAVMREALSEAWHIFDQLGAYQSDAHRLEIVHSPEFSSAAYRVRTAMLILGRAK
jgi:hypothetical protein